MTIVNRPVESLADRLGYKFTFKNEGTSEWAKQYDEFVKSIRDITEFQTTDETDFLMYFIEFFEKFIPTTSETLPKYDKGEFMFVEEDFVSTTGKEDDARFLYQRFKTLTKSLAIILPQKYVNEHQYVGRPFNQGSKKWRDYVWQGFSPIASENKFEQIQFQTTLHKEKYLSIGIWIDSLAKDKIDQIRSKIEQNQEEFFNLLKTLPDEFVIGVGGSSDSWEGNEFKIADLEQSNIPTILELLSKNKAEAYVSKYLEKDEVLSKKITIPTIIKDTYETIFPIYEYLQGSIESKYFIFTAFPDSDYDDIEGEQYHYDSNKPNYKKVTTNSKIIWLSKIDYIPYFLGTGIVKKINMSDVTQDGERKKIECKALIEKYQKFSEPKPRTDEIQQMLEDLPEYGNIPPSIIPITKKIYEIITKGGEEKSEMIESESDLEKLLRRKKQIIFYGPPGTGKTREALRLSRRFAFGNLTDEQYNQAIVELIRNYAISNNYEFLKEPTSEHLYSLKNDEKEIRLGIHFSKSEKENPETTYIGVPQKMVDFLNKVPEDYRFEIIVNNDVRNYAVLPYTTKMKYARFSGGDRWDPTGVKEHSFHFRLTASSCTLPVRDGTHSEKELECSNLLSNLDILNLNKLKSPFGYIRIVTFHQSYSYEEFVEGIKAKIDSENHLTYEIEDGVFKKICKDAQNQPDKDFILIIDEINRGNISKIFGELVTLLENDKRETIAANLAYSKERFTIPKNVFLIGTMNTADRSLVQLDIAIRRRFGFVEIMPKPEILEDVSSISLSKLLTNLNEIIIEMTNNRELQIGHSYFMQNGSTLKSIDEVKFVFETEIIPLLQEYFYDDYAELEKVLGTNFVDVSNQRIIKQETESDFIKAIEPILKYGQTSD